MSRLAMIVGELQFARGYVVELLDTIPTDDWFRQPSEGVTHTAWQVGHLAFAEFSLALRRIRGKQPDDEQLMSTDLLNLFGKGSEPVADPATYPSPTEIRALLERVHQAALKTASSLSDEELDQPVFGQPHRFFKTKLGSLHWCARHEMVHAGQLGLLRRLLGHAPLW